MYRQSTKIRVERKLEGEEKGKPDRKGKEPGVIYASLGTRLYLFSLRGVLHQRSN